MKNYDTEIICINCGNTYGEHRSKDDRCLNHIKVKCKQFSSYDGLVPIYAPLKTFFKATK